MDSTTKTKLTRLKKEDSYFNTIFEKIILNEKLNNNELSYCYSLVYLFLDEYNYKKNNVYFEIAYAIILRITIQTKKYEPLLEFSYNNGFFPIAKVIYSHYFSDYSINDKLSELRLENFKYENIIQLREQKEKTDNLIHSLEKYRAYIAPTSYGKSSFIKEDIKNKKMDKIAVIVPKKALIWQVYRDLKDLAIKLNYRILLHDTEYNKETRILGIFTQERAIRLIEENNIAFDILYIDEAHNLFLNDERNILLARLIKINKKKNKNHQLIYLSPLIKDSDNLKLDNSDIIDLQKIEFNIKEYDINYYDGIQNWKYNKYLNDYYDTNIKHKNWINYLLNESRKKNLIYFYKPADIEKFAAKLQKIIPVCNDAELDEIANILEKSIDKDYLLVDLIKRGILYIHGRIPDLIKDYLLEKFKKIEKLKYLISNSSILEGVNFPIDSLFIFNTYSMKTNDLINLCGRVNRLNEIFGNPPQLDRLICPIHFVQSDEFSGKQNLKNKIELLRSDEEDILQNPCLEKTIIDNEKKKQTKDIENDYLKNFENKSIRNILLKNNINNIYENYNLIEKNLITIINGTKPYDNKENLIEYIYHIFIECFSYKDFCDNEIARLLTIQARNFYSKYIEKTYYSSLKNKIYFCMNYFEYYKQNNMQFYIGESFGEIEYISNAYNGTRKTYIDPKNKTQKELINLAVIKTKIEDDFISFKISKFVKALLDLELINDDIYNKFIYGSIDTKEIQLLKLGMSFQLISFVKDNKLMNDIILNNGVIKATDKFMKILSEQDELLQFEIKKLL